RARPVGAPLAASRVALTEILEQADPELNSHRYRSPFLLAPPRLPPDSHRYPPAAARLRALRVRPRARAPLARASPPPCRPLRLGSRRRAPFRATDSSSHLPRSTCSHARSLM